MNADMNVPQHVKLAVPAQLMRESDTSTIASLDIEFGWTASDPYAITMLFRESGEEAVPWNADIDLFISALIDNADGWHGQGDISVQFSKNVCYVTLHGGDHERPSVIAEMSAVGLAPFINRVSRLRILHASYIAWLVSKELDELLEAA